MVNHEFIAAHVKKVCCQDNFKWSVTNDRMASYSKLTIDVMSCLQFVIVVYNAQSTVALKCK